MNDKKLNPGSPEAIDAGCTCPIIDNHYGRGYGGNIGIFINTETCPLHGWDIAEEVLSQQRNETDSKKV